MIIGFKTGPANWAEGQRIVEEDGGSMCEVWFRIDRADDYDTMFSWLRARNVAIGLHYWALVDGQIKPNISARDEAVRAETVRQIKRTIEAASDLEAVYVNIHPGALLLEKINFENRTQQLVVGQKAAGLTWQESDTERCLEVVADLTAYARERGVLLTIETILARELVSFDHREPTYESATTPLSCMARLAEAGFAIANDITHTVTWFGLENPDRGYQWEKLLAFTNKIAPATRLLHINTVQPPFNGTDSHDGILPADFANGVFPSQDQVRHIIDIFRNRPDVFIVPEPREYMQENYRELVRLGAPNIPSTA